MQTNQNIRSSNEQTNNFDNKKERKDPTFILDEEGRGRPAAHGRHRERLLLGQGAGGGDLPDHLDDPDGHPRRDPVGGAGEEGEPVGGRSAGDDGVDGVLEAGAEAGEVGLAGGFGGVEGDLDEVGRVGAAGAVAVGEEAGGGGGGGGEGEGVAD